MMKTETSVEVRRVLWLSMGEVRRAQYDELRVVAELWKRGRQLVLTFAL